MPRFICSSCKTGLYSAAHNADLIDSRCPACGGSSGEARPRRRASGGQSINRGRRSARISPRSADHRHLAARYGALMDRVHATRVRLEAAQARMDAERWLDDGGSFSPAAVASGGESKASGN
jgi:hypothetical protein